ncbi:MAG: hypothetical protein M3347_11605 [Armatimonadota bacterium]|nr:hypothetical protein [Armatimonadota bacterium]
MSKMGSVHEPEAELLSAEDAIQDAARLRALFRQRQQAEPVVSVPVPLSALLEAIDHLEPDALRQVARRAEERLVAAQNG